MAERHDLQERLASKSQKRKAKIRFALNARRPARWLALQTYAFHTCPGAVGIPAIALRVSTIHFAHPASS